MLKIMSRSNVYTFLDSLNLMLSYSMSIVTICLTSLVKSLQSPFLCNCHPLDESIYSFSLSKPCEKLFKSIAHVTIFPHIGKAWWIHHVSVLFSMCWVTRGALWLVRLTYCIVRVYTWDAWQLSLKQHQNILI